MSEGFFELKRDVFLKYGSGADKLASVIIKLEEENKKLLHIIETTAGKIKS